MFYRGGVTQSPIILEFGGTEQSWHGAKMLPSGTAPDPGCWVIHVLSWARAEGHFCKHSCLVQNTFTVLNCRESQEKGPLCWATNKLSMSMFHTVLWRKGLPGRTRQGNCHCVCPGVLWKPSREVALQAPWGRDTIKDQQHGKHGFLGCLPQKIPSGLPHALVPREALFRLTKNWNFGAQEPWSAPGEWGWGNTGREREEVNKDAPAAVADPLRSCGEGLATLSALSYCSRREEGTQRVLKNPQLFPGFYSTSEILQGRRKRKEKKPYLKRRYPC